MPTNLAKMTARAAAIAMCGVGLTIPVLARADVVVASSGPSAGEYAVGKKLAAGARITLRAGDSVTVLDAKGTRVLRGPGTFGLQQAGGSGRSAVFAALTRQRSAGRVRTGAVRDPTAGLAVRSPNLWYLDVAKPGKQCVVEPRNVRLWRAVTDKPAQLRIAAAAGSPTTTVNFAAGSMVAPINPAAVKIADGSSFVLSDAAGNTIGKFEIAVLPAQPRDPERLAEALIARGCMAQLELLASSLAAPG